MDQMNNNNSGNAPKEDNNVQVPKKRLGRVRREGSRSVYKVQFWREARRRWMMAGVLAAVALAVLAPGLGAPRGGLRAEYTSWLLVCFVHYSAGRRSRSRAPLAGLRAHARLHAVCVAHAHVVSPALTAAVVTALTDGVDYRIVKGVMLWSCGGGCAWLALALSARGCAPAGCALIYVVSLLATPLHTALLCGRASLPSLLGVVCTLCTTAAPFAAGALLSARRPPAPGAPAPPASPPRGVQLAALALLYAECCERLSDAEAILYLTDVLVAFTLEVCCVLVSAAWCSLYARAGVLTSADARFVALCALPRSLDTRWSLSCAAPGMCRLPGVFVGPVQALLLTALAPLHHDDRDVDRDVGEALPRSTVETRLSITS